MFFFFCFVKAVEAPYYISFSISLKLVVWYFLFLFGISVETERIARFPWICVLRVVTVVVCVFINVLPCSAFRLLWGKKV